MLFSAFALAVDRFVTIGRRTAQFCFGLLMRCLFLGSPPLRPPRVVTHATRRRALCTLAGTWEQSRTKILRKPQKFQNSSSYCKLHSRRKTSNTPKISNALSARLKLKTRKCQNSILRILAFSTESAGVMKSKLFPQCKQRIHPVFKYILYVYILVFFNRMILNSGRHIKLFDLFDARFWGWKKCI